MDTKDWLLYYKQAETEGGPITTQMCYAPLVSPDGSIFCMDFTYPTDYQATQGRLSYTAEFVNFMWEREVICLQRIEKFSWAPEVLGVDGKKIFIKWYGKTCNDLVYGSKDLEQKHPMWRQQIRNIVVEQYNQNMLKPTVYPHSHYFDDRGNMRAIDFYSCVSKSNPLLPYNLIESMIGSNSRFDAAREGDNINVETIFKSGLKDFSKWPGGLEFIYRELYPC